MSSEDQNNSNIQFSSSCYPPPRLAVVIRSIAPYLTSFFEGLYHEHSGEVRVFIGTKRNEWINPCPDDLLSLDRVDHWEVGTRQKFLGIKSAWPPLNFFLALDHFSPDALLVCEYSAMSILAALWAKKHNIPFFVATDMGPYYRSPYPPLNPVHRLIHKIMNRSSSAIIAFTPSACIAAKSAGKSFLFVPHSIDTSVYTPPENKDWYSKTFRIIATGAYIYSKGYDLLLHALSKLKLPDGRSWELECYGVGDPQPLINLASKLGISKNTRFAPFLGVDDLIKAYQSCHLFVHPSRSDTYAVVVHEAASCGLPLVVSKYAGAAEVLVDEGKNGFVIDPENRVLFMNVLHQLLSNPKRLQDFSQHSRCKAIEWDVRTNARRLSNWIVEQNIKKS